MLCSSPPALPPPSALVPPAPASLWGSHTASCQPNLLQISRSAAYSLLPGRQRLGVVGCGRAPPLLRARSRHQQRTAGAGARARMRRRSAVQPRRAGDDACSLRSNTAAAASFHTPRCSATGKSPVAASAADDEGSSSSGGAPAGRRAPSHNRRLQWPISSTTTACRSAGSWQPHGSSCSPEKLSQRQDASCQAASTAALYPLSGPPHCAASPCSSSAIPLVSSRENTQRCASSDSATHTKV